MCVPCTVRGGVLTFLSVRALSMCLCLLVSLMAVAFGISVLTFISARNISLMATLFYLFILLFPHATFHSWQLVLSDIIILILSRHVTWSHFVQVT
jgi:hypothetical protein